MSSNMSAPGPAAPEPSRWWSDWTSADFAGLDRKRAIAVLPLAATEQHGPHLPLSVDADIARGIIERAIPKLTPALRVLFLPIQTCGLSLEHAAFSGTLTLKAQTTLALWSDLAESVARIGIKKILLLCTHGGNLGLMDAFARDVRQRHSLLTLSIPGWEALAGAHPQGKLALQRFSADEQRYGIHAGQMETSMMLCLKPHLVHMERSRNFYSTQAARDQQHEFLGRARAAKLAWMAQDLNRAGAVGNAAGARAEDGRALLEACGMALARVLSEMDQLDPIAPIDPESPDAVDDPPQTDFNSPPEDDPIDPIDLID